MESFPLHRGDALFTRPSSSGPAERSTTSRMFLLAIYAVIPLCAVTAVLDNVFFDGRLKTMLPRSPEDFLLFIIFFNMPHIMASTVSMCDAHYLRHHAGRLLPAAIILAGTALFFPFVFYNKWFLVFYALWAILHFTGQQAGMTRTMGRVHPRLHALWRWMVLLIAIPVNFDMFQVVRLSAGERGQLLLFVGAAALVFELISWRLWSTAETKPARYYIIANGIGIAAGIGLYSAGYYFFVILISRVIHDVSAFTFYISHDANRNRTARPNVVYRALRFLPVSPALLSPALGLMIALPFTYYLHHDWAYRIWLPITLMHYYTDGFVWKKGSPHREHIHLR